MEGESDKKPSAAVRATSTKQFAIAVDDGAGGPCVSQDLDPITAVTMETLLMRAGRLGRCLVRGRELAALRKARRGVHLAIVPCQCGRRGCPGRVVVATSLVFVPLLLAPPGEGAVKIDLGAPPIPVSIKPAVSPETPGTGKASGTPAAEACPSGASVPAMRRPTSGSRAPSKINREAFRAFAWAVAGGMAAVWLVRLVVRFIGLVVPGGSP